LSSVKLKSKYVPFAFIVVDIDAESLGSVANEIDVTPVNVMYSAEFLHHLTYYPMKSVLHLKLKYLIEQL
jgi:hypothetical protein